MKRADALQPLSRQHKAALMTCLLVRKGISKQAPLSVVTDFFLQSFERNIHPHFIEEETKMIPVLKKYEQGKKFAEDILRDHELIRISFEHLGHANLNERLLENLTNLLDQHVRFEERIVFQSMQEFLSDADLNQFHFHEDGTDLVCNSYPTRFWE